VRRAGAARHRADFTQHDGTQDGHGTPTYRVAGDWDTVVSSWPCEMLTTNGAETLRGEQVQPTTTHVLMGEYHGAKAVKPDMRAVVDGVTYGVVAAFDPMGNSREIRIELKKDVE